MNGPSAGAADEEPGAWLAVSARDPVIVDLVAGWRETVAALLAATVADEPKDDAP